MSATNANGPFNLGFLTVVQENNSFVGGYLVTNQWGRPLGFWLSSAVQPNRVQQILYADTLVPYICGDLIGKTLVDKSALPVQAVFTDTEPALDLRLKLEAPVAFLAKAEPAVEQPRNRLRTHAAFPGDAPQLDETLEKLHRAFDLTEPFQRVLQAMTEAKKLGASRN